MKMKIWLVVGVLLVSSVASAGGKTVPNVFSFQSALYDEGGNPIADGDADVFFRIVDGSGNAIYDEYQVLPVVRGSVAALIGNGLSPENDGPTGGLSLAILDTDEPLYLEVEVSGYDPLVPMEIAAVPYAAYANSAYRVAKGGVDAEAIENGSISLDDLSADLKSKLLGELAGGREVAFRDDLDAAFRDPSFASRIGVGKGFNYSGSDNLQGVLADMDRAIKRRDERIAAEGREREGRDAELQQGLDGEVSARQGADNLINNVIGALRGDLDSETSARRSAINSEITARQNADSNLQAQINSKVSNTGGTIDGDIAVTGNVDGVDVSHHNHSGEGEGGYLYPDAIWFDAGNAWNGEVISLDGRYGRSECEVMVSFMSTNVNQQCGAGQIVGISTSYSWNPGGNGFAVYCVLRCQDQVRLCTASYFVMCIKGK